MKIGIRINRARRVPELRMLSLNARADEPREFRLLKSEATVGSGEDSQLVIRRPSVSRRHASFAFRKNSYEISDLGSTNGTFVNGRRISAPTAVEVGDQIGFGDAVFILAKPAGSENSSSARKSVAAKKILTLRGSLEVALLAFAVGFGAAQYFAYLLYHEENRLIVAQAVPLTQAPDVPASEMTPGRPTARSTPARTAARLTPTPGVAAAVSTPSRKAGKAITAGAREIAGGIALARLISDSGTEAGQAAPGFTLPGLNGTESSLGAVRGKVVLLNFWATWCGACRGEMPSLERLYRDFRSYGDFAMLTVSVNRRGKSVVAPFMASHGYTFPVLLDNDSFTSTAYGVSGIPSTFVIGRDGKIVWNVVGSVDWSEPSLRAALKKLL